MFWEQQRGPWGWSQEEKGTEASAGTLPALPIAVWFR